MKKIAIVGPESTGKSDMSLQLSHQLSCDWVPEFARFYLDRLDRPYEKDDLLEIAKGQLAWEDDKASNEEEWLICDTNLLVIKIWSEFKYGETDPWILEQLERRKYDFHLLMDIDLPWKPDPQREHPTMRKELFKIYESELKTMDFPYAIVKGIEGDRLGSALQALELYFD